MTIIQRYLAKEIIKQITIVLFTVVFIYVVVDFFEKSDNFMESGASFSKTIGFFMLNVPFIVSQISPVAILLAVVIIFSLMNKNNEMLALRASGVSFYSLLRPVLVIGFLGSMLLFFFSDTVVPITTEKANRLWLKEVKGKSLVRSKEKNIWIRGDHRITHINYYHPATRTVFGVSINFFDDAFHLIRKIDGEKGVFRDGKWQISELVEQTYNESDQTYDIEFRQEKSENLGFVPDDLKRIVKKPAEMSFGELRDYIRKVETKGYDATPHWVDLYAKPAYAFACVIMCMIAAGIALMQQRVRHHGFFFNIACGITLAFVYWIFYSFCLSLGYGEMLPPIVAAWIANIVFLCLGFFILVNIE